MPEIDSGTKKSETVFMAVLVVIVIFAAAGAGIYFYIDYQDQWVITNNAAVDGRIYTVSSPVPGFVNNVAVDENTLVSKGDLLTVLDSTLQGEFLLQQYRIRSPAAGYIANRQAEAGEHMLPGQPLMFVVNLEDLWVTANFTEEQIKYLRQGQEADIYIDAFPEEQLRGRVAEIMPAGGAAFSLFPPDATAANWVRVAQRIPVKIIFEDVLPENMRLRQGMLARVRVER